MPDRTVDMALYISVYEDFVQTDPKKCINMMFYHTTLKAMVIAMRDLTKEGTDEVPYRNFTGTKEDGKWVTLGKSGTKEDTTYYINFERTGGIKIPMIFQKYEFLAVAEIIDDALASITTSFDAALVANDKIKKKKRAENT